MSAKLLDCKVVAQSIIDQCRADSAQLRSRGIVPKLGIVRVGEKGPDLSYEKGATRTMGDADIEVQVFAFPADISQADYIRELEKINADKSVHGILAFRPLDNIDEAEAIGKHLAPQKDVDACTAVNMGKLIVNDPTGLYPCTPNGIMEILEYYADDIRDIRIKKDPSLAGQPPEDVFTGTEVCIVNNSNVIGKPLFMILTNRFAVVSMVHHLTPPEDRIKLASRADIVVVATPFRNTLPAEMVRPGAMIIDAGIVREKVFDEQGNPVINEKTGKQKIGVYGCTTPEAAEKAGYLTPVPGVGSVTSAMLAKNLIKACKLQTQ